MIRGRAPGGRVIEVSGVGNRDLGWHKPPRLERAGTGPGAACRQPGDPLVGRSEEDSRRVVVEAARVVDALDRERSATCRSTSTT